MGSEKLKADKLAAGTRLKINPQKGEDCKDLRMEHNKSRTSWGERRELQTVCVYGGGVQGLGTESVAAQGEDNWAQQWEDKWG